MSLGQGLVTPSLTSVVADSATPDRRGEVLGVQQSAGALSRIIGPAIAGLLFDHAGVAWPYVVAAVLFLLITIPMTRYTDRAIRQRTNAQSSEGAI